MQAREARAGIPHTEASPAAANGTAKGEDFVEAFFPAAGGDAGLTADLHGLEDRNQEARQELLRWKKKKLEQAREQHATGFPRHAHCAADDFLASDVPAGSSSSGSRGYGTPVPDERGSRVGGGRAEPM